MAKCQFCKKSVRGDMLAHQAACPARLELVESRTRAPRSRKSPVGLYNVVVARKVILAAVPWAQATEAAQAHKGATIKRSRVTASDAARVLPPTRVKATKTEPVLDWIIRTTAGDTPLTATMSEAMATLKATPGGRLVRA